MFSSWFSKKKRKKSEGFNFSSCLFNKNSRPLHGLAAGRALRAARRRAPGRPGPTASPLDPGCRCRGRGQRGGHRWSSLAACSLESSPLWLHGAQLSSCFCLLTFIQLSRLVALPVARKPKRRSGDHPGSRPPNTAGRISCVIPVSGQIPLAQVRYNYRKKPGLDVKHPSHCKTT